MEAIYPITALQKNSKAVRESAEKGIVRITENGSAAYIFCTEEVLEQRIQAEREDAAFEARLLEQVARGVADIDAGRFTNSLEEALGKIQSRQALST